MMVIFTLQRIKLQFQVAVNKLRFKASLCVFWSPKVIVPSVIGDTLSFNNTNTNGAGATGVVTIVNGGITGDTTEHIILEEETSAGDHLTGDKIVFESGVGDITDIYLTNGGDGYKSLPTVSVTSTSGSGAKVLSYGTDIGKILGIETSNLGIEYEKSPSPTLLFVQNLFVISVTGSFTTNTTVTGGTSGATGIVTSVLKLKEVSGTFQEDETVASGTGSAILKKLDVTTSTVNVTAVVDTDGRFINEKGHISESTMKVQDSLYYQDFSYVLKVGNSINLWRDAFKKTMHTSGFYFTGQVDIENRLNLRVKVAEAINTGAIGEPLIYLMKLIFETVFGRRIGTVDDGTSLRSNSYQEPNPNNSRDVMLTRAPISVRLNLRVRRKVGTGVTINQGFAYCGPSFKSINRFANTAYGVTGNRSGGINGTTGNTFNRLNELKVTGTRSSLDGTTAIFNMISGTNADEDDFGFMLKTNFAFPTDITFPGEESFSGNTLKFDSTNKKFDKTTV